MASKRILKELKDLQRDPPTSCSAGKEVEWKFVSLIGLSDISYNHAAVKCEFVCDMLVMVDFRPCGRGHVPLASNHHWSKWQSLCWWCFPCDHPFPSRLSLQTSQGIHQKLLTAFWHPFSLFQLNFHLQMTIDKQKSFFLWHIWRLKICFLEQ